MNRYPSNNIRRISCSLMLMLAMLTTTNTGRANTESQNQITFNKNGYGLTEAEKAQICTLLMLYPNDSDFRKTILGDIEIPDCGGDTIAVIPQTPPPALNRRMREAGEDVRLLRVN